MKASIRLTLLFSCLLAAPNSALCQLKQAQKAASATIATTIEALKTRQKQIDTLTLLSTGTNVRLFAEITEDAPPIEIESEHG